MHLDEREDVFLGQLVWVLGLLGVMHTDAIPPLPEEPAIVADAGEKEEKGGQRAVPGWSRTERSPPQPWQPQLRGLIFKGLGHLTPVEGLLLAAKRYPVGPSSAPPPCLPDKQMLMLIVSN